MKKQTILYAISGIVVLTIAVSALYYFVIFLPRQTRQEAQERQEFIFSMKQKCQDAGEKLYTEDVKELEQGTLCVPEYTYSEKLNTCLYAGCYLQKESSQQWIKDSFTNKEIYLFFRIGDEVMAKGSMCDNCVSLEEFKKRKQELFQ